MISTIRNAAMRGHLTLGLVLIAFSVPLAFSFWSAFFGAPSDRFAHMMQTVLPGYLGATAVTMLLSVFLAAMLALIPAYVVTFYKLPFSAAIDTALVLPLALPPYLVAVVFREALAPVGVPVHSIFGLAVVMAVTTYPYIYVLLRVSFQRQSAVFLETAASLGVGRTSAIRRVIIPLALPALALGGVLVAIESVSDFGAAEALSVPTLTLAVRRILFSAFDGQLALQVALLASVAPLFAAGLYWWFVHGRSFTASINRPRPVARLMLRPAQKQILVGLCLLPPLLGFFAPVASLTIWASRAFATLDLSEVLSTTLSTVILSVLVAACVAAIGLWVTLAVRKGAQNGWRAASIGILSINLALPSIVVGVSLLTLSGWARDWPPVLWASETIALLFAALVIKFAAFGFFSVESAFSTIPQRLEETGLASGRSSRYVLWRVLLPSSAGGVVIGATLAFLIAAKELTLSLTLHPFGFKSLSMSTYHLAKVDAFPEAAVLALCLIAICLYPVLSLHRWILR